MTTHPDKRLVPPGSEVSPKLDGIHAVARKDGIFTKSGKPIDRADLRRRLKLHFLLHPKSELKGELYKHGQPFDKNLSDFKKGEKLPFHAFPGQKHRPLPFFGVKRVKGERVRSEKDADVHYQRSLKEGYEGQVVRSPDGTETKRKPHSDTEHEIVDSKPGKTQGSLTVRDGSKTFKVPVTREVAEQRPVGKQATIITKGRHKVFKSVRDYDMSAVEREILLMQPKGYKKPVILPGQFEDSPTYQASYQHPSIVKKLYKGDSAAHDKARKGGIIYEQSKHKRETIAAAQRRMARREHPAAFLTRVRDTAAQEGRDLRRHEIVHSLVQQKRGAPPATTAQLLKEEVAAYGRTLFPNASRGKWKEAARGLARPVRVLKDAANFAGGVAVSTLTHGKHLKRAIKLASPLTPILLTMPYSDQISRSEPTVGQRAKRRLRNAAIGAAGVGLVGGKIYKGGANWKQAAAIGGGIGFLVPPRDSVLIQGRKKRPSPFRFSAKERVIQWVGARPKTATGIAAGAGGYVIGRRKRRQSVDINVIGAPTGEKKVQLSDATYEHRPHPILVRRKRPDLKKTPARQPIPLMVDHRGASANWEFEGKKEKRDATLRAAVAGGAVGAGSGYIASGGDSEWQTVQKLRRMADEAGGATPNERDIAGRKIKDVLRRANKKQALRMVGHGAAGAAAVGGLVAARHAIQRRRAAKHEFGLLGAGKKGDYGRPPVQEANIMPGTAAYQIPAGVRHGDKRAPKGSKNTQKARKVGRILKSQHPLGAGMASPDAVAQGSGYRNAKHVDKELLRHEIVHSIQASKRGYRKHSKLRELLKDEVGAYATMGRRNKGGSRVLRGAGKAQGFVTSTVQGIAGNPRLQKRLKMRGKQALAAAAVAGAGALAYKSAKKRKQPTAMNQHAVQMSAWNSDNGCGLFHGCTIVHLEKKDKRRLRNARDAALTAGGLATVGTAGVLGWKALKAVKETAKQVKDGVSTTVKNSADASKQVGDILKNQVAPAMEKTRQAAHVYGTGLDAVRPIVDAGAPIVKKASERAARTIHAPLDVRDGYKEGKARPNRKSRAYRAGKASSFQASHPKHLKTAFKDAKIDGYHNPKVTSAAYKAGKATAKTVNRVRRALRLADGRIVIMLAEPEADPHRKLKKWARNAVVGTVSSAALFKGARLVGTKRGRKTLREIGEVLHKNSDRGQLEAMRRSVKAKMPIIKKRAADKAVAEAEAAWKAKAMPKPPAEPGFVDAAKEALKRGKKKAVSRIANIGNDEIPLSSLDREVFLWSDNGDYVDPRFQHPKARRQLTAEEHAQIKKDRRALLIGTAAGGAGALALTGYLGQDTAMGKKLKKDINREVVARYRAAPKGRKLKAAWNGAKRLFSARDQEILFYTPSQATDKKGRRTDPTGAAITGRRVYVGNTAPDGSRVYERIPILHHQVVDSTMKKARGIQKWAGRVGNLTKDTVQTVAGKPRQRDAYGRTRKREWEKAWFKNAAGTAVVGGAGLAVLRHARANPGGKVATGLRAGRKLISKAGKIFTSAKLDDQILLDETQGDWDVRDARGRSARVFAPGSRKRVRREKEWHEEVNNERKLWAAGTATAALVGAGVVRQLYRGGRLKVPKQPAVSRPRKAKATPPANVVPMSKTG